MQGMSVALNDKLGFLLEEMPEGLNWTYEHGMMDSYETQMTDQNDDRKQPRQTKHKRSKSGKVKEVKTVKSVQKRRTKSRAEGMESLAGSSSRQPAHRRTQSSVAPSDRKSDAANNTSPGKVEEWDFMSVHIGIEGTHSGQCEPGEEERCPRPMSTLPLKEMDVAAQMGRCTPGSTPKKNIDRRHSEEDSHSAKAESESEASSNDGQALQEYSSKAEQEDHKDSESEEKSSSETIDEEGNQGYSIDGLEAGLEAVEKQGGVVDEDWRSPTFTTATADEVFDTVEDETARKNALQDSADVFTDALSRSCQSSRELDAERELQLADTLPPKKSFLRRRKLGRPANSEETTNRRKSKRPKLLRTIGSRLSKAARSQCCRFSFKACFCGADVSPGPELDADSADPRTLEQ